MGNTLTEVGLHAAHRVELDVQYTVYSRGQHCFLLSRTSRRSKTPTFFMFARYGTREVIQQNKVLCYFFSFFPPYMLS